MKKLKKSKILMGTRPTAGLTVANYLGAIKPIIELQKKGESPLIFVADLHAYTDKEPREVQGLIQGIVADYLALGIDPKKTKIYLQSSIEGEVGTMTLLLARLISVAELLRVPTLKEKIKNNSRPETANALLLMYPVMMAADILLNKAEKVAVGEDQEPHMEVARFFARKFNKKYGKLFPIPQTEQVKTLKILSLKGEGKMSKSSPDKAIFLTDDIETVIKKIKKAETALPGVMNDKIKSLVLIAKELSNLNAEKEEIDNIIKKHKAGEPVMGPFKQKITEIITKFILDFQKKRSEVIKSNIIEDILKDGNKLAKTNATETLLQMKKMF